MHLDVAVDKEVTAEAHLCAGLRAVTMVVIMRIGSMAVRAGFVT
jgi:hypothetical protein